MNSVHRFKAKVMVMIKRYIVMTTRPIVCFIILKKYFKYIFITCKRKVNFQGLICSFHAMQNIGLQCVTIRATNYEIASM